MRRFAISDIHGCSKTFNALLEKLELQKDDQLYLLGDFIDRGINSKGVVDKILQLKNDGYKVDCLLGNHEWMLMNSIYDYKKFENWMKNGGSITLDSYKISELDYIKKIPHDHLQFFRALEYYIELEDYYLVHAGFNFKDPDPFSDYESMIWLRDWHKNIKPEHLNGKKVIHGHAARIITKLFEDLKNKNTLVYNIDCSCVYDSKNKLGVLCAFNMDDITIITQKNLDN
ncbi:MAG: serine/threonine protein phosphatase [Fimbriimonadaceae bacterium]|nr:serine/threonine protein phosphatase [Chitinophagales bacterium]